MADKDAAGKGMELRLLRSEGVPDGTLVSIRIGTMRRQAPLNSHGPYKFSGISGKQQMKVDIYAHIASSRLIIEPGEARRFPVHLQPTDGMGTQVCGHDAEMSLEFETPGFNDLAKDVPFDCDDIVGETSTRPSSAHIAGNTSTRPSSAHIVGDTSTRPSSAHSDRIRPQTAGSGGGFARRHHVEREVQEYLGQHQLIDVMQTLAQSVIKEKPADPYAYMIRLLENSKSAAPSRSQRPQSAMPERSCVNREQPAQRKRPQSARPVQHGHPPLPPEQLKAYLDPTACDKQEECDVFLTTVSDGPSIPVPPPMQKPESNVAPPQGPPPTLETEGITTNDTLSPDAKPLQDAGLRVPPAPPRKAAPCESSVCDRQCSMSCVSASSKKKTSIATTMSLGGSEVLELQPSECERCTEVARNVSAESTRDIEQKLACKIDPHSTQEADTPADQIEAIRLKLRAAVLQQAGTGVLNSMIAEAFEKRAPTMDSCTEGDGGPFEKCVDAAQVPNTNAVSGQLPPNQMMDGVKKQLQDGLISAADKGILSEMIQCASTIAEKQDSCIGMCPARDDENTAKAGTATCGAEPPQEIGHQRESPGDVEQLACKQGICPAEVCHEVQFLRNETADLRAQQEKIAGLVAKLAADIERMPQALVGTLQTLQQISG